MRFNIVAALSLANVAKGNLKNTKAAFFELDKQENSKKTQELFPGRLRGLTSYNAIDSVDYANAKKVERRVDKKERRYKKAQKLASNKQRATTMADLKGREAIEGKNQEATDIELTCAMDKLKPLDYDII